MSDKGVFRFTSTIIFSILLLFIHPGSSQSRFQIIIKNATVIDGTGRPSFQSDIGIRGKKIIKIGTLEKTQGKTIIDAKGLMITPGFIDVHTHCDRGIAETPTVDNYIQQGVTTVIGGNCGGHRYPLKKLFHSLEDKSIVLNFGSLVGHNTIRRQVMGYSMDKPTPHQIQKMKALITEEMKAGALGFSTGLAYIPGTYSDTEELIQCVSAIKPFGGIYATHLRDQGKHITQSIKEAIEIGEKNNVPVQISHIKLAEDSVWGKIGMITEPVEQAREKGMEVYLDQYPYTATSSGFASSFPSWAFEGGTEKFLKRLTEKDLYQEMKQHIIQRRLSSTRGINKLQTIYIASYKKNHEFQGKNLREILLMQGKEPTVDSAAELIIQIQKNGGAQGVFFQMDEKDVEALMKLPYTMHASDGGVQTRGEGVPHPRNYGTFPRVLSYYVKQKKVLPMKEAVRKMTSLPAKAFRIENRGIIRPGMFADIVIFDPNQFKDQATFSQPHQYSQGVKYVIVNGDIAVKNGNLTGNRPGMVIFGSGKGE
ncbi:MAG: amidohydrolase family protein [Candidatus Aminicenantes bacterium]|nr:amidohydrolase family protein [Candidatus Aminicenantes bacterium]